MLIQKTMLTAYHNLQCVVLFVALQGGDFFSQNVDKTNRKHRTLATPKVERLSDYAKHVELGKESSQILKSCLLSSWLCFFFSIDWMQIMCCRCLENMLVQ